MNGAAEAFCKWTAVAICVALCATAWCVGIYWAVRGARMGWEWVKWKRRALDRD